VEGGCKKVQEKENQQEGKEGTHVLDANVQKDRGPGNCGLMGPGTFLNGDGQRAGRRPDIAFRKSIISGLLVLRKKLRRTRDNLQGRKGQRGKNVAQIEGNSTPEC